MESNKKGLRKEIIMTIISIILGCAVMWPLIFSLFTCSFPIFKDLEIYESGYFKYVIVGSKEPFVAIVGFTETGLTQETLEIPREIDGKPVRRIGYHDEVMNNSYYLYSENLKKIYIQDNIDFITNFEKSGIGGFENGIEVETEELGYKHRVSVMICSMNDEFSAYNTFLIKNIYYYGAMIDEIDVDRTLSPANIVFMNNYFNEMNGGYYRLDYIETNETIPTPPAPKRDGYIFIGWYTEAECINLWDFNVSPALEEGEEFRLYAKWRVA